MKQVIVNTDIIDIIIIYCHLHQHDIIKPALYVDIIMGWHHHDIIVCWHHCMLTPSHMALTCTFSVQVLILTTFPYFNLMLLSEGPFSCTPSSSCESDTATSPPPPTCTKSDQGLPALLLSTHAFLNRDKNWSLFGLMLPGDDIYKHDPPSNVNIDSCQLKLKQTQKTTPPPSIFLPCPYLLVSYL